MAAALGASAESDFVAKNFTLVFGGVVLNQFKVKPREGEPDKLDLESGSADARVFVEGGYRRRWAWLARDSALTTAMKRPEAQVERDSAETAAREMRAAELAMAAANASEDGAKITAAAAELGTKKAALEVARRALRAKANTLGGELDTLDRFYSIASRWREQRWFALVPDDRTVRLGFVFDGNSDSNDVVGTVGASDLYGEVGFGWNLVRWADAPQSDLHPPTRASLNLEADILMYTDDAINDVHGRGIVGPSVVFGVPMFLWGGTPAAVPGTEAVPEQSIIELVARLGYISTEVPSFVSDDSREVVQKNGSVDFRRRDGFGFDVELNVPITERLGYLVARGHMNSGFDPNPWFIQLGYTIPLSSLVSSFTSGS